MQTWDAKTGKNPFKGTADRTASVRWIGVAGTAELQQVACNRILDAAAPAIEQRGQFLIVLAGGDTPAGVYRMLRGADTD